MISQIGASAGADTRAPQAQVRQAAAADAPAAKSPNGRGEEAVVRKSETAEAVEAARQSDRVLAVTLETKRSNQDRALPDDQAPDADALAGPTPAFEITLLEREASQALTRGLGEPAQVVGQDETGTEIAVADPTAVSALDDADLPEPEVEAARRLDVPPTPSEQAETEVATVRQIESGGETASVDVTL